MTENRNICWHETEVTLDERRRLTRQKGAVIWFTGLSGSGKSTLAHAVEKRLIATGHLAYVLDGDNVRHGLNKDLGFSSNDRQENVRRISEVSALFAEAGVICLAAFISPFKDARSVAKEIICPDRFFEIYVSTPLEVCEQRDVKNLYKKARAGKIENFTGISSPYEVPENPDLSINTAAGPVDDCASRVIGFLEEKGVIWNA